MRLALLLVAAILLLPLAHADQSVAQGPATLATTNTEGGDGCEAGDNGYAQHTAQGRVILTDHESLYVRASSWCSASYYDDHMGNNATTTWSALDLSAGRQTDDSAGPYAQAQWWDMRSDSSWGSSLHACGSNIYVAGPVLALGCWPNGDRPPMLPILP